MRLNYLLVATATLYGLVGAALIFAPDEIFAALGLEISALLAFLAQALGAALFALAMLNTPPGRWARSAAKRLLEAAHQRATAEHQEICLSSFR